MPENTQQPKPLRQQDFTPNMGGHKHPIHFIIVGLIAVFAVGNIVLGYLLWETRQELDSAHEGEQYLLNNIRRPSCEQEIIDNSACLSIDTNYYFDKESQSCIAKQTSGCPAYTPFDSMWECQQICESQDTESQKTIDKNDWQTYRNEEFGFEIQYPEDWFVLPPHERSLDEFVQLGTRASTYTVVGIEGELNGRSLDQYFQDKKDEYYETANLDAYFPFVDLKLQKSYSNVDTVGYQFRGFMGLNYTTYYVINDTIIYISSDYAYSNDDQENERLAVINDFIHGSLGLIEEEVEVIVPVVDKSACIRVGCSGTICVDEGEYEEAPFATTCQYLEEYACYNSASCERQADDTCGWTHTDELDQCLHTNSNIL